MVDGQPLTRPSAKPQESVTVDVWSALCAAQAEFPNINKTADSNRGKYAPLDEVIEALRPVLTKHGLTSTALPFVVDGLMLLRRKLHHGASGTAIELEYPVAPVNSAPQVIGSALTYARRYSLLAICEVHPTNEDDGGEKAGEAQAVKSANVLKKAEVWPPLIKALKLVERADEFLAWKEANEALVAQFPRSWLEQLDEEVEKHRETLRARRQTEREARDHV